MSITDNALKSKEKKELLRIIDVLRVKLFQLKERKYKVIYATSEYRNLAEKCDILENKCVKYEDLITQLYSEILTLRTTCGQLKKKDSDLI